MKLTFTGLILVLLAGAPVQAETISPLLARGFTVMPQPQTVKLGASDFEFGAGWKIEVQGVAPHDVAIETLKEELDRRYRLKLGGAGTNVLRLILAPNSVAVGAAQDSDKQALAEQAYKIDLSRASVIIAANAPAGLYYGAVTFVQLLKPSNGALLLPEGHIEDWPDLQTRQIYWDDAHHLDRMETLKQALRQAAFFKINGFALKLEGHFQFKSAPALVEPQAMTPAELQELTDYGLRYHVQLIPYLDGPGHIAFILKHPEYAKLREYPESNYELCATNPDSYKLMFGMFQDLIDANKGVKYFYLSTDEPYYVGMADNAQCQEGRRAKELGSVGKMLAEFTTKTANYLHDRGRTVVFWGEYPMKPEDLASLPSHLVNGEVYGPQFDPLFKKHGIREMIYTSSEGEEKLFPDYFPLPGDKRVHAGRGASRRVTDTFQKITFDTARRDANLIGSINAGWADMGLHPETFWLGYATSAATGWHPGSPDPAELMATFYPLFYGRRVANMNRVYELMSTQAQFWSDSWDQVESKARKPIWGNSYRIFDPPRPANDQTFPLPPAPAADLTIGHDWAKDNAKRFQLAAEFMRENDELLGLLHANLARADANRYNLEVFLAIAHLYRQNLEMLQTIHQMNAALQGAEAARISQPKAAVASVDRALELANAIRYGRNVTLADAIATWYKAWFPRVAEANGRRYLHELDDVKDHLPDRTVDMTYLIYRQLLLPLGEWVDQVRAARNQYAQMHNLPVRNEPFDWKDLKPVYVPPAPEEDTE
ncbi:MAG TPA: glycoside hydrolase family 20 zincin-like fold domain-containing protein [Bryobacteraceae bacterium]|nr:glycoside hydrolase family 20 zincin-like fold domain-containing protein [Bryobacteraceae bacterium]